MIYLKHFNLAGSRVEEDYLNYFKRTCFDSYYPFLFFPNKGLEELDFADITIFCGGNGSGKSTLLNIISEKLGLQLTIVAPSVQKAFWQTQPYITYAHACSHHNFLLRAHPVWPDNFGIDDIAHPYPCPSL